MSKKSELDIIAYSMCPHDNDSYMLGEEQVPIHDPVLRKFYDWRFYLNGKPHPATCSICGSKTDDRYSNPDFILRKKMDLGMTYDGYHIASESFLNSLLDIKSCQIGYKELIKYKGYYWIFPQKTVSLKKEGLIKEDNYCTQCDRFCTVTTRGVILDDHADINPQDVYFSDVSFGSGHEKSPAFIIGVEVFKALTGKYKKIDFEPMCRVSDESIAEFLKKYP